jgi:hypothetical protein
VLVSVQNQRDEKLTKVKAPWPPML